MNGSELMKIKFNTDGYWIGASDVGQEPGHFMWANNKKVDTTLWATGNPKEFGTGKKTCVNVGAKNGYLYDGNCSTGYYYMCQLAYTDLPCL